MGETVEHLSIIIVGDWEKFFNQNISQVTKDLKMF